MKKYRKTALIEVVQVFGDGSVLVQNEGDPSDKWIISKELFHASYEEVKE